uniref:Uncharacterized protein n=1 Tax=Rhizophora mucronata TaxID=61149 RepID=A0A2P2MZ53_RHIMU
MGMNGLAFVFWPKLTTTETRKVLPGVLLWQWRSSPNVIILYTN